MYARRQRRVQSAITNCPNSSVQKPRRNSETLNPIVPQHSLDSHARPRWRSGHAVDCRSTILRFKSGPWLSIAATAGVSHPDPFRTRKLRHLTWIPVLRYASPWERILAAIVHSYINLLSVTVTSRSRLAGSVRSWLYIADLIHLFLSSSGR